MTRGKRKEIIYSKEEHALSNLQKISLKLARKKLIKSREDLIRIKKK